MNTTTKKTQRDYAMFDADISGAVLNLHLLRRLLRWLAPYKVSLAVSTVLVLLASTLQVMLPMIMTRTITYDLAVSWQRRCST